MLTFYCVFAGDYYQFVTCPVIVSQSVCLSCWCLSPLIVSVSVPFVMID